MNPAAGAAPAADPGTAAQANLTRARRHSRDQVIGLAVQFLLGMAVNLLGLPSQATGAAHAATTAFLAAHIAVAAALLASAVMVVRSAARAGSRWRRLATWGAAAIVVTVAAGVLALSTKSNWWSYAMAAGFISSLLIYGAILIQPGAPPRPRDLPKRPQGTLRWAGDPGSESDSGIWTQDRTAGGSAMAEHMSGDPGLSHRFVQFDDGDIDIVEVGQPGAPDVSSRRGRMTPRS